VVVVAIIGGSLIMGLWGMIFAVPTVVVVKTAVETLFKELKDYRMILGRGRNSGTRCIKRLSTSNQIESVFAATRHRTVRTKGALSAKTAKLMEPSTRLCSASFAGRERCQSLSHWNSRVRQQDASRLEFIDHTNKLNSISSNLQS
jgi:hypothetical protein